MAEGFALDHITVADARPDQLVTIAAATGYRAVCLFLESMDVLPRMPSFSLVHDAAARRATRERIDELGIGVDVVYPFTLAGRTDVAAFQRSFEAAADLGATFVNVLQYDRDPGRALERVEQFCALAKTFQLKTVVEFFPPSQVRSLADALRLVTMVDAPGQLGVNVDLLHLYRSGGSVEELALAPPEHILYAQYCDAPLHRDASERNYEASSGRMLGGEGALDLRGFSKALPPGCQASVELPREDAIDRGLSRHDRAEVALASVLRSIAR